MRENIEFEIFEQLENSTNTGCWKYDIEKEKLWWSKKTYELHKVDYDIEPDVSKAIDFYHKDDQALITEAFKNCIEKAESYKLKLRILDTSGELKYVESYGRPMLKDDKVIAVFGTFKNISQEVNLIGTRKIIERKLSEYTSAMEDFFIIAETDSRGVIRHVNKKFCEISQYSEEELIGKTHKIVHSDYHPKGFFKQMWESISSGKPWEGLICNKAKDGSLYWVQSLIFPYHEDNETSGYLAIRFDVTEKVNLQKRLEEEKKNLEFAHQLAAIGEISTGIAHEINNPLTVIIGKSKVLEMKELDREQTNKVVKSILASSERIRKIVKGLRELGRKSKSENFEKKNLEELIKNTFEFCEEALKSKFINLTLDYPEDNIYISSDEVKFSQILLNLINNARDAIEEAKVEEKWIKIVVQRHDKLVDILVYDSGPGVPEEVQDKIFDSYYTTKKIGKGTGIGLSLVKKFIKEHKGEISLVKDSSNTCFKVTLPIL